MIKKRKPNQKALVLPVSDNEDEMVRPQGKKIVHELPKAVLSSSTAPHKQKLQSEVKESFDQLNYKGTNAIAINSDVAVLENLIDTDKGSDARAKFIENIEITKKIKDGALDTGVYRGLNGYANYTANEEIVTNSKHKSNFAPLRAPTNIRVSCRFDYNPELCKDWHDCGYCVFGNSCLYLHDRTTYKTGWEQEKDFEQQERERWKRINNPDYQEEFQFKAELQKAEVQQTCPICTLKLTNPVNIECGHLFCESCAIKQHQKKKKCFTCGKTTTGILNDAEPLLEKQRINYQNLKKSLEVKAESNKVTRRRFKDEDSQRIFQKQ